MARNAVVALAAAEPTSGDDLRAVPTTAVRDGDGWTLTGAKIVTIGAPLATHLLITARNSGEFADTDGMLQHRMVDMNLELEQSVAAMYLAILNLNADPATGAVGVGDQGNHRPRRPTD